MKTMQKIRDGKFSVELHTFGSGEPLLYLHGAGGLLGIDPFLEELGKNFKVIAPHLPGFGESTGGDQIDDVIDAALFYHQLMDELGIDSAPPRRPFDGWDARGRSRRARRPSREETRPGRSGGLLDRRNIRFRISSRST